MKKKILIVLSDYYNDISDNLLNGALKHLQNTYNLNMINKYVVTTTVPGVFEIPVTIATRIKDYDGFIALGCVIKGQTPHFDFISRATTDAIMRLSVDYKKPIGNGIITCLDKKQAIIRSKKKGQEAANAVGLVLEKL
tara:strand:- start:1407 stop:1820 length:414 start_codon:yes stop_codon:yes gene_type:complete